MPGSLRDAGPRAARGPAHQTPAVAAVALAVEQRHDSTGVRVVIGLPAPRVRLDDPLVGVVRYAWALRLRGVQREYFFVGDVDGMSRRQGRKDPKPPSAKFFAALNCEVDRTLGETRDVGPCVPATAAPCSCPAPVCAMEIALGRQVLISTLIFVTCCVPGVVAVPSFRSVSGPDGRTPAR